MIILNMKNHSRTRSSEVFGKKNFGFIIYEILSLVSFRIGSLREPSQKTKKERRKRTITGKKVGPGGGGSGKK